MDVAEAARDVMREITISIAVTDTAWQLVHHQGIGRANDDCRAREILRAAVRSVVNRLHLLGRSPFSVKIGRRIVRLTIEFHEADQGGLVGTIMVDGRR